MIFLNILSVYIYSFQFLLYKGVQSFIDTLHIIKIIECAPIIHIRLTEQPQIVYDRDHDILHRAYSRPTTIWVARTFKNTFIDEAVTGFRYLTVNACVLP